MGYIHHPGPLPLQSCVCALIPTRVAAKHKRQVRDSARIPPPHVAVGCRAGFEIRQHRIHCGPNIRIGDWRQSCVGCGITEVVALVLFILLFYFILICFFMNAPLVGSSSSSSSSSSCVLFLFLFVVRARRSRGPLPNHAFGNKGRIDHGDVYRGLFVLHVLTNTVSPRLTVLRRHGEAPTLERARHLA